MVTTPPLYRRISQFAATELFAAGAPAACYCDKQFAVIPSAVLCFFTIATSSTELSLESPSTVIWRPTPGKIDPRDYHTWLPDAVREVQRPVGHHLFLRESPGEEFVYVGLAHLGSYGNLSGSPAATFCLDSSLPRPIWDTLGGYPGWSVEINHSIHQVEFGNIEQFSSLVSGIVTSDSHLVMNRFEQDSLHVFTNKTRAWLMYLRQPGDSGLYLSQPSTDSVSTNEQFQCCCGTTMEFQQRQTTSQSQAIFIAREFFLKGVLPKHVEWEEQ